MQKKSNSVPTKKVEPVKVTTPTPVQDLAVDKTRTYLYETGTRKLVKDILADGYVSVEEKNKMLFNHNEIIRDFLVAVDFLDKIEKNPAGYSRETLDAARFVVNRLMRARELSLAKMQQIQYANFVPPQEKALRAERAKRKEHLDINFNLYQIFALNGNAHEVISYARNKEKERIMTPQEVEKTQKRIMDLVNQVIEKGQDERYIRQFLENSAQERV